MYTYVMARKMYTFWIDQELADGLKHVKARDGVSESEQIRRAVHSWLRAKGALKRQVKKEKRR
jgi:Ribbon-helix-helix protein, copG family